MSAHTVTVEFDTIGYGPSLTFKCSAPADAGCRNACMQSECEEGCVSPGEHPTQPLDYCNVVTWMENGDDIETWIAGDGGRTEITAPVEIEWDADGPNWRFEVTS